MLIFRKRQQRKAAKKNNRKRSHEVKKERLKIPMPLNREKDAIMEKSKSVTKDPVCGMTVEEATAISAERDGKKFYFCSDHCRQKFLSTPVGTKPKSKPE